MIRVLTVDDVCALLKKITLKSFFLQLIDQLKRDFRRWHEFDKSPRHACLYPQGIIELMPISDKNTYSFKYVNGHPENTKNHKLTVIALGLLANAATGYPLLISEMTLLTALRTAATSALATELLARKLSSTFGIIGTGAQSEFQTLAHVFALGIKKVFYFDTDSEAMKKFASNLQPFKLELHPCKNGQAVVENSDIITTATATKTHVKIIQKEWVKKGAHINGIGGDSPGKTELDPALAKASKIVVELLEQTTVEGEIQQIGANHVYAELWEIITGRKKGRETDEEITLFDSVGFALEDYSTLQLLNRLATEHEIGHKLNMIPDSLSNPKDLFSLIL